MQAIVCKGIDDRLCHGAPTTATVLKKGLSHTLKVSHERATYMSKHLVHFPVSIALNSKGQSLLFKTQAVNISRSSIQISCDSQPIEALMA